MTIKPRSPWGREVDRPDELVVVDSDAAIVDELAGSGGQHALVAIGGGDLARTLGNPPITGRSTLNELPIDLMRIRLDERPDTFTACAHLVARSPWYRGGWWRGPLLMVMNAEYHGHWDVAPRGHPNDGRVEMFLVDGGFGVRERLAARRRLPMGTHVPHPSISTRSVRSGTWEFPSPRAVFADGRSLGLASAIEVVVAADAATVYA